MGKFDKLSREDLLRIVNEQERKLQKRYGLVWDSEREPEEVVLQCRENLPVLERVKGKEVRTKGDNSTDHILIEGDNFHALSVLNYTHKGKIDVIYIDPPYNTGNKDFIYNDRYVDKEDDFRHSKWLTFMSKRLLLAKQLLKDTGVIFLSINDEEQATLKLLCDEVFGEKNFVATITVQVNKGGRDYLPIAVTHEYLLVYFRGQDGYLNELPKKTTFDLEDSVGGYELRELRNRNPKFSRENRPNLFYPIFIDPQNIDSEDQCLVSLERSEKFCIEVLPVNSKSESSCWRWGKILVKDNITNNTDTSNVVAKQRRDGGWNIYEKSRKSTTKTKSIWDESEVRTEQGTLDLKVAGMGDSFDHPKPVYLIKKIIQLSTREGSVILDFFAGSGTTGHSVLDLNTDGIKRQFIIVTNNGDQKSEHKIAQDICQPRLSNVMKGHITNDGKRVPGLGGNLQYFKTAFVKKAKGKDQLKYDLTHRCTDMLCVREGMYDVVKEDVHFKIFATHGSDAFLGVYYSLGDDSFGDFVSELKKLHGTKKVYVFSLNGVVDQSMFKGVKDVTVEEIPQEILNVYYEIEREHIPLNPNVIRLEMEKAKHKIEELKDKDDAAKNIRVALEKTLERICFLNNIPLPTRKGSNQTGVIVETLVQNKVLTKPDAKDCEHSLSIGNAAMHGSYDEYTMKDVHHMYEQVSDLVARFEVL